MKFNWPSLKALELLSVGMSRAITVQMRPVVSFERTTLRTAIMAYPSDGPGCGGLEQSLWPQRQGHEDQDDAGQHVVLRSPVEIPQLLANAEHQPAGDRPPDAPEPADGEGEKALQREGQPHRRVREGDRRDGIPGEAGDE